MQTLFNEWALAAVRVNTHSIPLHKNSVVLKTQSPRCHERVFSGELNGFKVNKAATTHRNTPSCRTWGTWKPWRDVVGCCGSSESGVRCRSNVRCLGVLRSSKCPARRSRAGASTRLRGPAPNHDCSVRVPRSRGVGNVATCQIQRGKKEIKT